MLAFSKLRGNIGVPREISAESFKGESCQQTHKKKGIELESKTGFMLFQLYIFK